LKWNKITNQTQNSNNQIINLFNLQDTLNIITKLKNKVFTDLHTLINSFIKLIARDISIYLNLLFNIILNNSYIPTPLKHSIIIPKYKKGSKLDPTNYRPIANLSPFAKIFEKIISTKLTHYLTTINFFSNNQYGFRNNMDTQSAIIHKHQYITEQLSNNNQPITLYLDITRAFESVNHKLLIYKLKAINLDNQLLKLFTNYLNNRTQTTIINSCTSKKLMIKTGFPQGSILGPLLFNIYINDLLLNIPEFIQCFADDTILIFTINHLETNLSTQQYQSINKIDLWFKNNLLIINNSKSNILLYSTNLNKY
jgi:hypothetical protein